MDRATLAGLDKAALIELILCMQEEYLAALVAARAEVAERRGRLGQDSSTSSRPPSSDPPWAGRAAKAKGGQPGHPGHHRALLPPERVDRVVAAVPTACGGCGAPLAAEAGPADPALSGTRWSSCRR